MNILSAVQWPSSSVRACRTLVSVLVLFLISIRPPYHSIKLQIVETGELSG